MTTKLSLSRTSFSSWLVHMHMDGDVEVTMPNKDVCRFTAGDVIEIKLDADLTIDDQKVSLDTVLREWAEERGYTLEFTLRNAFGETHGPDDRPRNT